MPKVSVFLLLIFSRLTLASPLCEQRVRGVFDVGSGTIKLNLFKVELCPKRQRLLGKLSDPEPVAVALERTKTADGALDEHTMDDAAKAIARLREDGIAIARKVAPEISKVEFGAAGTHAFRTAKNAEVFAGRLLALGVPIVALTQEQEALSGLNAIDESICKARPLLVWDIGGGSLQLTRRAKPPEVVGLPLGAETFRKSLHEQGLKAPTGSSSCARPADSINPLHTHAVEALHTAERAATPLPLRFRRGDLCVVGIGSVHAKAVLAQIATQWSAIKTCACGEKAQTCAAPNGAYTRHQLACLAEYLDSKTECDPELAGPYGGTAVSNLYLVLGFMKALHTDIVHVQNVNMGHGLALDREQLKFQLAPVEAK